MHTHKKTIWIGHQRFFTNQSQKEDFGIVFFCRSKLGQNWKPIRLVISTSSTTKHKKRTTIKYRQSFPDKFACISTLIVNDEFVGILRARLHLLLLLLRQTHQPPLQNLVLLMTSNFFSRGLDPNIPYKHSETGITLLIWPWPVMIAGEDLSLIPQTLMNLPCIPLRTLWISLDFTDVPLACGDTQLNKHTK